MGDFAVAWRIPKGWAALSRRGLIADRVVLSVGRKGLRIHGPWDPATLEKDSMKRETHDTLRGG